jgi:predicted dehydrogenase
VPARTLDLEVEGLAEVLILHDSGVLSSVHMNFVQRDYRRGCQLVGDQGTLYWDYEDAWISIRRERPPAVTIPLRAEETSNDAYVEEVKYFLCCVRDSVQTMNSVERAAETLSVALDAKALAGATMRGRV